MEHDDAFENIMNGVMGDLTANVKTIDKLSLDLQAKEEGIVISNMCFISIQISKDKMAFCFHLPCQLEYPAVLSDIVKENYKIVFIQTDLQLNHKFLKKMHVIFY